MGEVQQTPFMRGLASSDRRTRDKALESLNLFLRSRRDLELKELLKVWKGLFFCFYHSDRPLTQQSLARALSYTLLPTLPDPILQPFLRAFWITMSREFHSLDRLRLDKYLFLIRCYVGTAFEILLRSGLARGAAQSEATNGSSKKRKRDKEEEESLAWRDLETYISMLEEGPLSPYNFDTGEETNAKGETKMPKGPDGIRYHLMDLWLDEIEKCATETETLSAGDDGGKGEEEGDDDDEDEITRTTLKAGVPMELLLRPIVKMQEKSPNKTVRKRAAEALGDERLFEWGVKERKKEDNVEDEEDEWAGFD